MDARKGFARLSPWTLGGITVRAARPALMLLLCSIGAACSDNYGTQSPKQKAALTPKEIVVRTVRLSGFDSKGEPSVRVLSDGRLRIVFEFMPPSWAPEFESSPMMLGRFEDFDKQLERALGVPVHWEDREFFLIEQPREDTIARLTAFVQQYPRK